MRFAVKRMDWRDLDEVVTIATSLTSNLWSKNMFIGEMLNPLAHCFVVSMKGRPKHPLVGFICFRNVDDESELLNIGVHPQYRQLGIGKKLMQFYIGFCSQMKIRTFHLEVDSLNQSAIHLYQSFSYHSVGIRKKLFRGEFDAILMVRS